MSYPGTQSFSPTPQAAPPASNTMAIAGLVLAFLFWPAGLVLSILGLRKAGETGQGRGMAIAGIVISIVAAVVGILAVVLTLAAAGSVTTV